MLHGNQKVLPFSTILIHNSFPKLSSPAAYPHLSSLVIEDLQTLYTSILHSILSHPSLLPSNLSILPGKKSWLLHLDLIVLSDSGNVFDALFIAAKAALWDTKVPRTRIVGHRASGGNEPEHKTKSSGGIMGSTVKGSDMDVDLDGDLESSFDTRQLQLAMDFELDDYWGEGDVLDGRDRWPLCTTLNVVSTDIFPRSPFLISHRVIDQISPTHFLDATLPEQASTPLRLLLMFSFPSSTSTARLQGMRTLGAGELTPAKLTELIKVRMRPVNWPLFVTLGLPLLQEGEKCCREIWDGLDTKLKDAGSNKMAKGKAKERTTF